MKKLFTIAVIALVFASLASCKKDYVCTCTGDEMGTLKGAMPSTTEKKAKDACDALQVTYQNGDATVKCELD
ncbi:MAG TPA: hypothetical protein PKW80_14795 [Bacteroidales bacterium]|nr:hypothetical protein [Bacteroidales bacterium]